jgi:hypothetical protein
LTAARAWARLAVVAGLGLAGCGSSSPRLGTPPKKTDESIPSRAEPAKGVAPETDERDPSERARQYVASVLKRVADVRGLAPRAAVESKVLTRAQLLARVRRHVDEQIPRDVIGHQGEFLVALGLVGPDFDYEAGALSLLGVQLAGFFEPSDKVMYLAADLGKDVAFAALAHELVHALQDQHYDLGRKLSYQPGANDRESAIQSLAEGDATSAMMDVMLADASKSATDIGDDELVSGIETAMSLESSTKDAPRVLQASLLAPYVDGVRFVHALRRRGGWKAVDDVWRAPPQTTEQLLHLDKLDARERAEEVDVAPAPEPEGWTAVYDDVYGEQGLRIVVEEWAPGKAAAIAAGWAGDRGALYQWGSRFAAAWHVRFDRSSGGEQAVAKRAFDAIAPGIRPGAKGRSVCAERSRVGPLAVAQAGRDLVLVAGPYRREGDRVSSDANCAQTARWAADILAGRSR